MISFWVNDAGAFGIENYLKDRGEPIAERFLVRRYEWREATEVARGPQIFAALDQLQEAELEAAGAWYEQLALLEPQLPLLNNPRRCPTRYELLCRLADQGLNSFRAYRAEELERVARFPVFVREDRGHQGSLTPLLGNKAELQRALLALRMRGHRKAELLIVEYCDTSDRAGLFRKYSAFRIGPSIVPSHLMTSRTWMVKHETALSGLQVIEEEIRYHEENPYHDWLKQVFALAEVEYGRIDFGVQGDRPQAWEINTNPTIGRAPGERRAMSSEGEELKEQHRQRSHARLRSAFMELEAEPPQESTGSGGEVRTGVEARRAEGRGMAILRLEPGLLRRIERQAERNRQRQAVQDVFQRVYHQSALATPLRALVRRLLPRP